MKMLPLRPSLSTLPAYVKAMQVNHFPRGQTITTLIACTILQFFSMSSDDEIHLKITQEATIQGHLFSKIWWTNQSPNRDFCDDMDSRFLLMC